MWNSQYDNKIIPIGVKKAPQLIYILIFTLDLSMPEIARDVAVDAVPKKRHSKTKKRWRKGLWKKKAFKQADRALMIARKIRNQADDEE